MRNMISKIGLLVLMALTMGLAAAQTAPYQNPVYMPNAYLAPVTISAPGSILFTNPGKGTLSLRVSGTCTSLAGTLQASNDGTNYTVVNFYPVGTVTSPSAASAVAGTGFWKTSLAGYSQMKVVVTALTASCTFAMLGGEQGFSPTSF